jgi:hypothetical protein
MSQIARAYAVPTRVLAELSAFHRARAHDRFWQLAHLYEVAPGFGYSGEVVSALAEFLGGRGLGLPLDRSNQVAAAFTEEYHPVALAGPDDSAAIADGLSGLAVSDADLARYWREFTGNEQFEAEIGMRAALEWLIEGFREGRRSDWCVISVG